jgi:phage terminase large subunit-like protein
LKDSKPEVEEYIEGVLSGRIIASKLVKAAAQRHLDDLKNGEARGLYFNEESANYHINFFPCIKHTTGEYAGEPFELRAFQKFIIWVLFGWKRVSDDMRRFRFAFISMARGNGKSPFVAALLLMLFAADDPPEPRAQVYSFATKEKQARIVWEEAYEQVGTSPVLESMITRLKSNMNDPSTGSKFEPSGSDSKVSDGWIIHGAGIDELHAWSERHRGLFEKIETAMGKRRQPMAVIITTAGDDQSDIWQEVYDFCVQVVNRDSDVESDQHFVFIAEIDREEPCEACGGNGCGACGMSGALPINALDEKYWAMANPMLLEPHSPVKIDHLRTMANAARIQPVARNKFLRYHANQLVASFYRLISPELWAKGNGSLTITDGMTCYAGFDWGWRNDLAALAMLFPMGNRTYQVKVQCWIPEECKRDLSREPWATWIRLGLLSVTQGDTTDVDAIYQYMADAVKRYEIKGLAYDPNNAREFSTKCVNEWGIATYDFWQTCRRYNEPTRELLTAMQEKRLLHGGNPLLAWCAGNLCVREDSNEYIMPAKSKSADKIDPCVSTIMALGIAMTEPQTAEPEFYS